MDNLFKIMDKNLKTTKLIIRLMKDYEYFSNRSAYYAEQCSYLCEILIRFARNYSHIFQENFTEKDRDKIETLFEEMKKDMEYAKQRTKENYTEET